MSRRTSTGYGEVPYRGEPEPDELKSRHRRQLSRREKQQAVIMNAFLALAALMALALAVFFFHFEHNPYNAVVSLIIFILLACFDVYAIGAAKNR
jgi:hypothetical protein